MEDVAVTLREMAEGNGWEAVTDGSFGPEQQELQAVHRSTGRGGREKIGAMVGNE